MGKLPDIVKAIIWTGIGIAIGITISGVLYQCTVILPQ